MASQINTLLKQAILTFGGVREKFPHNLEKLRHMLDKITGADVGFMKGHDLLKKETWEQQGKAPVSYVDIYEDNLVTVGVFVLKPGMKLPLHDHPHMYGLIKVIAGTVEIRSYSITKINEDCTVEVEQHWPVTLRDVDGSCILEPHKQNLHEIESIGGAAAFLDVLSPPYDTLIPDLGPRKCTYFKPLQKVGSGRYLMSMTDSPPWFWTDSFPYTGPDIVEGPLVDTQEQEGQ